MVSGQWQWSVESAMQWQRVPTRALRLSLPADAHEPDPLRVDCSLTTDHCTSADQDAQRHHRILAEQPVLRADGDRCWSPALGVYSALHLPIDAVPDLTNVQVQVITEAPALSPLEVESLLSFPVEGAMSGLPNVEQIRSISKFGVSVVTIVFKEGTDIYRARQLVGERLPRAAEAIPPGYGTPMLGPIATALGEVFQFQVKATKESGLTPMELRTLLDWFIAYQLRGVEGVTEINAHGGEMKTYQVEVDPDKLATYQLSMTDAVRCAAVEQRQRRRRLPRPRRRGALHPRREPGAERRRHRRDRHRRAQRRSGHGRRRGQGRTRPR